MELLDPVPQKIRAELSDPVVRKDDYDAPLPDREAYLERIGMTAQGTVLCARRTENRPLCSPSPLCRPLCSLELLNRLIYQHQCTVPFENLDIYLQGRTPSLNVADLFEKIVLQRRGGYCFELNGLFVHLLKSLGFRAHSVLCRVVRGMDRVRPCLHRGCIVTLEEEAYFCDVGFGGPMPACAVALRDGNCFTCAGQTFGVRSLPEGWWLLLHRLKNGAWEEVLQINPAGQPCGEFLPANAFCSGSESVFARQMMVNLRREDGYVRMTEDALYRISPQGEAVTGICSEEQRRQILQDVFGLRIDNGFGADE